MNPTTSATAKPTPLRYHQRCLMRPLPCLWTSLELEVQDVCRAIRERDRELAARTSPRSVGLPDVGVDVEQAVVDEADRSHRRGRAVGTERARGVTGDWSRR